jgi:hypothetical protein
MSELTTQPRTQVPSDPRLIGLLLELVDMHRYPHLKLEDFGDSYWVTEPYGSGQPLCYKAEPLDINAAKRAVEQCADGYEEAKFWHSPRGQRVESDEAFMRGEF